MADYVKTVILRDTTEYAHVLLCGSSDGSGESAVTKIDIDATFTNFRPAVSKIRQIIWAILSEGVELYFDHTTPQTIGIFTGTGKLSDVHQSPIVDKAGAGGTGDIMLTTHGAQANISHYTIFLELQKVS